MKKIIKNILALLPNFVTQKILRFYRLFKWKSIKCLYYSIENDLKENCQKLDDLDLDKKYIQSILEKNKLDFYQNRLSWHYHLFSGLSKKFNNIKILEIGTHKGEFTNFISKIFKDSEIYSFDLPSDNHQFVNTYKREDHSFREQYLKKRNELLNHKNINFFEMNSLDLLNKFEKEFFDIIWLDGDHTNPQVTIDTFSAFHILKKKGLLLCDDIFLDKDSRDFNKSQAHEAVKLLTKSGKLKTEYIIKRIHHKNAVNKKYVSFSIKK
tara:strand:+ start:122 stop:922 length:801 start_codon:yes stop_codon:yes gene_type:complete